jgi:lipopolysaccharide transport system ATP-binding protein
MNKDIIIKAENISKQYRLGQVGTGTLSHDFNRWWHQLRGKENPYLQIGDVNDRSVKGESDYVWALQDINFEVERGEVLGIIGKNGAGKSTLLKILSKVTAPTTGIIKSRGRIASLLEVGTGFNPELTGKENIYLNGAILGMTKKEISSKIDEIIDFSGCERYIDTPVKRYSSGMYVRLAFAVAAHLESEILIVDEVLAVGDTDFQKKCLSKMGDISKGEGRTVLFVSHNMDAVRKLTSNCIVLENGGVIFNGDTKNAINNYLSQKFNEKTSQEWIFPQDAPGNGYAKLKKISIKDNENLQKYEFNSNEDVFIEIEYWDFNIKYKNTAIVHIINEYDETLFATNEFNSPVWESVHDGSGIILATCKIPSNLLAEGKYTVLVAIGNYNPNIIHVKLDEALTFSIVDPLNYFDSARRDTTGIWPGLIRPKLEWNVVKI